MLNYDFEKIILKRVMSLDLNNWNHKNLYDELMTMLVCYRLSFFEGGNEYFNELLVADYE